MKRKGVLRVLQEGRRHWPGLAVLLALIFSSGVLKSYAASFFGRMVDEGMAGQTRALLVSGALVVVMCLLDAVRLGVSNIQTGRVAGGMQRDTKVRLFEAIAGCKLSVLERDVRVGDALARITHDLPWLYQLFSDTFTWLITVYGRGLVAIVFCVGISWKLSLVYILFLPLIIALMNRVSKPMQALRKQGLQSRGQAYAVAHEALAQNTVVKAYGAEETMDARFDSAIKNQMKQLNRSEKRAMALTLVSYLGDILQVALIFLLGTWLIARGEITVGALVAFITLSTSISEAFSLSEKGIVALRDVNAHADRVFALMDLPAEDGADRPLAKGGDVAAMQGLSFAYDEGRPVLRDISLRLEAGQRVALVGPSGCGKSTLAKLVCMFYDGYGGDMALFGQDARGLLPGGPRSRMALVSQDACLFEGTIADNVRGGRPDATDGEIEQALRAVQLWAYVQGLPQGMHTEIGDFGGRMSGGQRQRLAIARALIRDAELIILDEATSALDTQTEADLQAAMETLFAGKTVLVIAHRFAALRGVSYVYCLDQGQITEEGTVDTLLARDGYLRRMADAQAGAREEVAHGQG